MSGEKILIVEDEAIICEDIKSMLKFRGYNIIATVSTGNAAIKIAEEQKPDLILMDIILSGELDGISAIEIIKEKSSVPFIFMTAHSDDKTLNRAKATAPHGYILKPINSTELYSTIEIALYKHELEAKLIESEERYRSLYDRSFDGIFLCDFEGNFFDANNAALEITGYERKEIRSLNFTTIISEEHRDTAFRAIKEIYERGGLKEIIEIRIKRKDGSFTWIEAKGSLIFEDGSPQAVMGIFRDITNRKHMEDILKLQHDLTLNLSGMSNLKDALETVIHAALKVEGINCGGIYLFDKETDLLNLYFSSGHLPECQGYEASYSKDDSYVKVVLDGSPVYFNSEEGSFLKSDFCMDKGLKFLGIIPIKFSRQVVGSMNIGSHTANNISQNARYALESICSQIGNAIVRIRIEEIMRESEERLRSIIDSMDDLIFVIDKNGVITDFFQPQSMPKLYLQPREFLNKSYKDFLPANVSDSLTEAFNGVLNDGKVHQADYTLDIDGSQRWHSARLSKRVNSNGEFDGVTAVVRDITDKVFADKSLIESEEKFHKAFNASSSIMAISTLEDGIFVEVNQAFTRILGYEREEVIGKTSIDLNLFRDSSERDEFIKKIIEKGYIKNFDVAANKKNGDILYGLFSAEIIQFQDKRYWLTVVTDITEIRIASQALRESRERLLAIINATNDALILMDPYGTIIELNKAAAERLNREYNDIIGRKISIFIKDDPGIVSDHWLKGFQDFTGEKDYHNIKFFNERWYETYIYPIHDNEGSLSFVAVFSGDITDMRELERHLMTAIEEERRRIGQDLHDELGQKLSTIAFLVEALRKKNLKQLPEAENDFNEIKSVIGESIDETKNIARGLLPVSLEPSGLIIALEELAKNIKETFGINCRVKKSGILSIRDSIVASNLYYIIREAVNNSVKHSKTENIEISIMSDEKTLRLEIEDDGKDSDSFDGGKTGMGLKIMKYRANLINAEFHVEKEKGYKIILKINK